MQFFSEFSYWGPVQAEFRQKIFFLPFLAYLIPFWLEILPEIGFLIFWMFSLFFSKFSGRCRVWTEFGPKIFFFLFLGLSHPVVAKNIARKRVFNFMNFFAIFFAIFFLGLSMNEIRDYNFFFLSFSAYLIPFLLKIMPERGFFNFFNFFLFFLEFSCPGRVWTELVTKIFLSLFWPILSRFG